MGLPLATQEILAELDEALDEMAADRVFEIRDNTGERNRVRIDELLADNADDEHFCNWVRDAGLGAQFPAAQGAIVVRRVA